MKAIAAMDVNRGIGFRGKLPWPPFKEDMRFFRKKTLETGKVVMGRDTFLSVGVLKDRYTYILTHEPKLLLLPPLGSYRYVTVATLQDIGMDDLWLCGGVKAYMSLLPLCSDVYVTHILNEYQVDSYMPTFEDKFPLQEVIMEHKDFWIVRYYKHL